MRRTRLALAAVLAASIVVACAAPRPGAVVDGWDLGDQIDCRADECTETFSIASWGLDLEDPGHAPIVEMTLFRRAEVVIHQPTVVVVLQLIDGSTRAIGVGPVGIGAETPWDAPNHPLVPGGLPPDPADFVPA